MLMKAKATATLPAMDLNRARKFYEEKLGLKPLSVNTSGPAYPDVMYEAGGGTKLYLYQRGVTKAEHTEVAFEVDDIEKEVRELKSKGVAFEEYDMPGLKTMNSIADMNGARSAWFKDTEGNILSVTQMKR